MQQTSLPFTRYLNQLWQRLRLKLGGAGAPCIREFYTSDFIILDGAICKIFWKVENAWRLTLEPVLVPGGHAVIDVTGRIYADIVASAQHHTLYLHAEGINGKKISQILDLQPLSVGLNVPSPILVNRSQPLLPLAAQGKLRFSSEVIQTAISLLNLQERANLKTETRLHLLQKYIPIPQQRVSFSSRLIPVISPLCKTFSPLVTQLEQLRKTSTVSQARQVGRLFSSD